MCGADPGTTTGALCTACGTCAGGIVPIRSDVGGLVGAGRATGCAAGTADVAGDCGNAAAGGVCRCRRMSSDRAGSAPADAAGGVDSCCATAGGTGTPDGCEGTGLDLCTASPRDGVGAGVDDAAGAAVDALPGTASGAGAGRVRAGADPGWDTAPGTLPVPGRTTEEPGAAVPAAAPAAIGGRTSGCVPARPGRVTG